MSAEDAGPGKPGTPNTPGNGRRRGYLRNSISLVGTVIAVASLGNIIFLVAAELFSGHSKPYLGLLAYMIMPVFLVFGVVLIVAGVIIERRKRHRAAGTVPGLPRIDLNDPRHRGVATFLVVFTVFFVLLTGVGSYQAYEFTDSIHFCGQLCHVVMAPEFAAYQASPHARVRCVDCHVGPGATWYVRSKLSGLRQVYKVASNTFPRPITTPVHDLRPAQETCEQCHWPEKFWGAQLKTFGHYSSNENNTPRRINLLIKTGGGSPSFGQVSGIHWHMNIANKITYVSTDPQRQNIVWVRMKDRDGKVTDYTAENSKMSAEEIAAAPKRRMDCVDCHNRPSHIYVPPDRSVDRSMFAGRIDPVLPYVKKQSVELLTAEYKTTQEALDNIASALPKFYEEKYPQISSEKKTQIQSAVNELQLIFKSSIFPEMKVDWRVHPDNIGHFYSLGCFRCHDGQHKSADGKVIARDCDSCHTMLSQDEAGKATAEVRPTDPPSVEFVHPEDIGDIKEATCSECHTGGSGP